MRKTIIICFSAVLLLAACKDRDNAVLQKPLSISERRLSELSIKMANYLPQVAVDSNRIPRALAADGSLIAENSHQWTSGFFPGTLWLLYGYSKDAAMKNAAKQWTAFLEKEKWDGHTHDLGFKLNSSFGNAYKITNNPKYKDVVVQASKTLINRYNNKIGCIRSWDWNADVWQFPVIIDNIMNLEMLFEATAYTGDSTFYNIARQHAKTTLKNHYRPDFSCFHVVDYDTLTGEVRLKTTHQGYSDGSAWSRGQAWGLYGYTMAYGKTKDPAFLEQAKGIAQFFFNHPRLPADKIPYWDFDAPNIPNEPRDVSAAAVAACGLLELCEYNPANKTQYLTWADAILASLAKPEYQSEAPPFLLDHSTGSVPGEFEVDVPIVYADYYYVTALLRRLALAGKE